MAACKTRICIHLVCDSATHFFALKATNNYSNLDILTYSLEFWQITWKSLEGYIYKTISNHKFMVLLRWDLNQNLFKKLCNHNNIDINLFCSRFLIIHHIKQFERNKRSALYSRKLTFKKLQKFSMNTQDI